MKMANLLNEKSGKELYFTGWILMPPRKEGQTKHKNIKQ